VAKSSCCGGSSLRSDGDAEIIAGEKRRKVFFRNRSGRHGERAIADQGLFVEGQMAHDARP